jgi:threonine/homoserine/homoserine lactone efflux protein
MKTMLVHFLPVAALLTLTPGVSTVLVVRRAALHGRRAAVATTIGNEAGVIVWAVAAAVGLATVVATSAVVFTAIKLAGAAVLIAMGIAALRHRGDGDREVAIAAPRWSGSAFRDGATTAIANPKLAVFFVALFPQFVPHGQSILVASLTMAAMLVVLDLIWYSLLATLVARAADAFLHRWLRRVRQACGAVLVALGIRLVFEAR